MAGRKRKRAHPIRTFILTLIIVLIAGVALLLRNDAVRQNARQKSQAVVEEQVVKAGSELISDALGGEVSAEDVQQVLDSVSDEDKNTILKIAENHQDSSAVTEIASALESNDTEKAEEIARNTLTPEEIQTLEGLYEKYQGQIGQ